jgi:hypothetical protein
MLEGERLELENEIEDLYSPPGNTTILDENTNNCGGFSTVGSLNGR